MSGSRETIVDLLSRAPANSREKALRAALENDLGSVAQAVGEGRRQRPVVDAVPPYDPVTGVAAAFAQGATADWGDEIVAALTGQDHRDIEASYESTSAAFPEIMNPVETAGRGAVSVAALETLLPSVTRPLVRTALGKQRGTDNARLDAWLNQGSKRPVSQKPVMGDAAVLTAFGLSPLYAVAGELGRGSGSLSERWEDFSGRDARDAAAAGMVAGPGMAGADYGPEGKGPISRGFGDEFFDSDVVFGGDRDLEDRFFQVAAEKPDAKGHEEFPQLFNRHPELFGTPPSGPPGVGRPYTRPHTMREIAIRLAEGDKQRHFAREVFKRERHRRDEREAVGLPRKSPRRQIVDRLTENRE